ncbi:hypothetical protein PAPYR_6210 [Paratrimastix pyriformis]|uniref:Uncharacterized protein n=1 Tax=Paratrimastix pyriformis TaxID=342808 RepID=A0ABQ8UFQ4_9EUKA|nr:hypothetical protein PAPYR_6210 [Paratrimastix pyriformis]
MWRQVLKFEFRRTVGHTFVNPANRHCASASRAPTPPEDPSKLEREICRLYFHAPVYSASLQNFIPPDLFDVVTDQLSHLFKTSPWRRWSVFCAWGLWITSVIACLGFFAAVFFTQRLLELIFLLIWVPTFVLGFCVRYASRCLCSPGKVIDPDSARRLCAALTDARFTWGTQSLEWRYLGRTPNPRLRWSWRNKVETIQVVSIGPSFSITTPTGYLPSLWHIPNSPYSVTAEGDLTLADAPHPGVQPVIPASPRSPPPAAPPARRSVPRHLLGQHRRTASLPFGITAQVPPHPPPPQLPTDQPFPGPPSRWAAAPAAGLGAPPEGSEDETPSTSPLPDSTTVTTITPPLTPETPPALAPPPPAVLVGPPPKVDLTRGIATDGMLISPRSRRDHLSVMPPAVEQLAGRLPPQVAPAPSDSHPMRLSPQAAPTPAGERPTLGRWHPPPPLLKQGSADRIAARGEAASSSPHQADITAAAAPGPGQRVGVPPAGVMAGSSATATIPPAAPSAVAPAPERGLPGSAARRKYSVGAECLAGAAAVGPRPAPEPAPRTGTDHQPTDTTADPESPPPLLHRHGTPPPTLALSLAPHPTPTTRHGDGEEGDDDASPPPLLHRHMTHGHLTQAAQLRQSTSPRRPSPPRQPSPPRRPSPPRQPSPPRPQPTSPRLPRFSPLAKSLSTSPTLEAVSTQPPVPKVPAIIPMPEPPEPTSPSPSTFSFRQACPPSPRHETDGPPVPTTDHKRSGVVDTTTEQVEVSIAPLGGEGGRAEEQSSRPHPQES